MNVIETDIAPRPTIKVVVFFFFFFLGGLNKVVVILFEYCLVCKNSKQIKLMGRAASR